MKEAVVTPPEVLSLTGLPASLPSIWNWTVPVGVPVPGAVMLMVAVKVSACPNTDGLAEETSTVLVPAWAAGPPTNDALLPAAMLSPPLLAVPGRAPAAKRVVLGGGVVTSPE